MEIENWIINWFEEKANIEKNEILKNIEENYLELGWIDSLKFISFITDIEEFFNIRFSNDIFQNDMNNTLKNMENDYNNNSKDLGLDTTFDDFLDIIRGK